MTGTTCASRGRSCEGILRGLLVVGVATILPALGLATESPRDPVRPLPAEYVLVVTGSELLDGSIGDAHTPFIARTLRPLGLRCVRSIVVEDTGEDLRSALREATGRARLVLTTGGLGPTANDLTRDALAAFTGVRLREDPTVVEDLAQRFGQPAEQLRRNLRQQALVPVSGGYLPNERGTAVGLIYETAEATLIALPGPPRELQPMVTEHLVPWLRTRLGLPEKGASVTLRFVGIGQSAIAAALGQQIPLPAGTVTASRFEGSRVDFTFSLPEDTPAARNQLEELSAHVARHLARYLYATNQISLEEVAWHRLAAQGDSLILAEAQGPHLAAAFARARLPKSARITSVSSSTEQGLRAILNLQDAVLDHHSDPAQRVKALGEAARRSATADWVLVVGESALTDEGRGTVWAALGYPDGTWETWRLTTQESPETGRPGLVNMVLDRLRRLER